MESAPTPDPRRRLFTARRALLSVLLAAAAGGFWLSAAQTRTEEKPTITDSAVEALHPAAGDLDLRQGTIGVDLVDRYTGVLFIDGVEIPEDQLERVQGLGQ